MKELEPKDQQVVQELIDQQKEYKRIGHIQKFKNTNVYYFNMKTFQFGILQVQEEDHLRIDANGKGYTVKKKKAYYLPECMYLVAVNQENAMRKFNKTAFMKSMNFVLNFRGKSEQGDNEKTQ